MSQDLMNYDSMTQLALRGVIRDAIRRVIRENGLPGAHHFYITFLTRFPGVDIDEGLVTKYPEEVTIVLEHQYWDLKAHDDSFEVTLKFGGVPKYLSIPYIAITRFHDPSVGFAMQFDPPEEMEDILAPAPNSPPTLAQLQTESAPKLKSVKSNEEQAAPKSAKKTPAKKPTATGKVKVQKERAKKNDAKKDDANKVVSLDAFRKK